MFTLYDKKQMQVPLRVWLGEQEELEGVCYEQAMNLAKLPFVHKWVSLMPDTHAGKGMPIGGVLPTKDVIIPNAVGNDIGCGMAFIGTNIPVSLLRETETPQGNLLEVIVKEIMHAVPVGFAKHKIPVPCYTTEHASKNMELYEEDEELLGLFDLAHFQVGTLGGGNHFLELQEDEHGFLGIMVHSGSRGMGAQICQYFNGIARDLNEKWHSAVPESFRLAFLPVDSKEGQQYIHWMDLALHFAFENREKMLIQVQQLLEKWLGIYKLGHYVYDDIINCHHNYASLEHHYGEDVWVHRKGATRAREGELAVIPGAMGSYSYVVMGLGNPESFESCSHGAGRRYSRTQAKKEYSAKEVLEDLVEQDVVLGKKEKADVAEESRFAYKDIQSVMEQQKDLTYIVKTLKTVGVVKG